MTAFISVAVLTKDHNRKPFDCGVQALNDYLQKCALQNQKKKAARTFVAVSGSTVIGYYTLSFGQVSHDEPPTTVASGMPPYPIPVILLARLAVDKSQHGQGIGAGLLKDALLRALHASEIAGLRAMLVHAKDTAAESFYKKFGFEPSPRVPLHLFLTMSQIEAMLGPVRH